MPMYEFLCRKCGREFEELVFGPGDEVACPGCGGPEVERRMSTFAFRSGGKLSAPGGSGCSGCHSSSCSGCGH